MVVSKEEGEEGKEGDEKVEVGGNVLTMPFGCERQPG